MKLASVRIVTNDIDRLSSFYTVLTGVAATRLNPDFAEIRLEGFTLALSTELLVLQFNAGAAIAAANRSAIFEFLVDDVDGVHKRLGSTVECVMEPTTMPWGNRSLLLRDPDGNLVNIFSRPAP
ncbi:VOC family protein [Undibacterium sp.]|uniref:VOC family protein n=1 Tax=Undibacterium sp. TaxID=1914977 RepID=UPI00374CAF53